MAEVQYKLFGKMKKVDSEALADMVGVTHKHLLEVIRLLAKAGVQGIELRKGFAIMNPASAKIVVDKLKKTKSVKKAEKGLTAMVEEPVVEQSGLEELKESVYQSGKVSSFVLAKALGITHKHLIEKIRAAKIQGVEIKKSFNNGHNGKGYAVMTPESALKFLEPISGGKKNTVDARSDTKSFLRGYIESKTKKNIIASLPTQKKKEIQEKKIETKKKQENPVESVSKNSLLSKDLPVKKTEESKPQNRVAQKPVLGLKKGIDTKQEPSKTGGFGFFVRNFDKADKPRVWQKFLRKYFGLPYLLCEVDGFEKNMGKMENFLVSKRIAEREATKDLLIALLSSKLSVDDFDDLGVRFLRESLSFDSELLAYAIDEAFGENVLGFDKYLKYINPAKKDEMFTCQEILKQGSVSGSDLKRIVDCVLNEYTLNNIRLKQWTFLFFLASIVENETLVRKMLEL